MQLMKAMTHSKTREVRKTAINAIKAPYSAISLMFLGKRLRDRDADIRRLVFQKLTNNNVTIEHFECPDSRMLIIKEGLTDPSELVREACVDFLK